MAAPASPDRKPNLDRLWHSEARAAINFWQALEYLEPHKPPKVSRADGVWPAEVDDDLPWWDSERWSALERMFGYLDPKKSGQPAADGSMQQPDWRHLIHAGIIPGEHLVDVAREHLRAGEPDEFERAERRRPSPATTLALEVNALGVATGKLFVSTVPWALARIVASTDGAAIEFGGFFGDAGVLGKLEFELKELLVDRGLIPRPKDPSAGADPAQSHSSASEASQDPDDGELRPLRMGDLQELLDVIYARCGWRPTRHLDSYCGRTKLLPMGPVIVQAHKVSDADNAASSEDPLNSFCAEDMEQVDRALCIGDVGPALQAYLSGDDPFEAKAKADDEVRLAAGRVDLRTDRQALIAGVQPERLPAGCWPAKHPLVTAQQFAVNQVISTLLHGGGQQGGLFSVNGPPGTGKSTLLKDIVAAVVIERAERLHELDDPMAAFVDDLVIEDYVAMGRERPSRLDARLRDFGIVVSSSNNGAVENITQDLPGREALDRERFSLDYFSVVAESLAASAHRDAQQCVFRRS